MRQVTRKGLISVAAAGGVLALGGGYAYADAGAQGNASNSPGVLSGNNVQVPVNVPVNLCGNTVNVVGVLNPAMGNRCANVSDNDSGSGGGAQAEGGTSNSPGVGSGNHVQVPVDMPVNVCGNSVDVVGLLSPAAGNDCENVSVTPPSTPPVVPPGNPPTEEPPTDVPDTPTDDNTPPASSTPNTPEPQTDTPPGEEELAETGAGSLGAAAAGSAGLLLAGTILYRRARSAA